MRGSCLSIDQLPDGKPASDRGGPRRALRPATFIGPDTRAFGAGIGTTVLSRTIRNFYIRQTPPRTCAQHIACDVQKMARTTHLEAIHFIETRLRRDDGFHLIAREPRPSRGQALALSTCMISGRRIRRTSPTAIPSVVHQCPSPSWEPFRIIIRTMNPSCCGPSSVYCYLKQYSCYGSNPRGVWSDPLEVIGVGSEP